MKINFDCPDCPHCFEEEEEEEEEKVIVLYKHENAGCSKEVIVNGKKMTIDKFREERGECQKKNKNFGQWKK